MVDKVLVFGLLERQGEAQGRLQGFLVVRRSAARVLVSMFLDVKGQKVFLVLKKTKTKVCVKRIFFWLTIGFLGMYKSKVLLKSFFKSLLKGLHVKSYFGTCMRC